MKNITELEAFEVIACRVNQLFNEGGDEIEMAFAKLNPVESAENLDDEQILRCENFTNAIVMTCIDRIDVPLTDEEQARADYENAMLIQSKRDRREWEASHGKQT